MAAPSRPSPAENAGTHAASEFAGAILSVPIVLPAAATVIFEGLLLYGYARGILSWQALLVSHVAVVCLLGLWVAQVGRAGRNAAMPLLTAIAVAATGPLGALAALVTIAFARQTPEDRKLLDDWYERIAMAVDTDDVTQLCDQVATGRTADLADAAPRSFTTIMQSGSLADRQTALGIIARNFHPDYLPALALALKNPEPVIRVQAAAVATRVRGDLRSLVDGFVKPDGQPAPGSAMAITAAGQLRACIASGLLDEGDRMRAGILASRLGASAALPAGSMRLRAEPVIDRHATEVMMLCETRFGALRVARRIANIEAAGMYQVRRARRPSVDRRTLTAGAS